MTPVVRWATEADLDPLAHVWHDAWHEAHAHLVPAELVSYRTYPNFRERLGAVLAELRVVGEIGAPLGFCQLKNDELYQLFVAPSGRGGAVASALMADAESRLRERGYRVGWLACAIGNVRAARFYEKAGWQRIGVVMSSSVTPNGDFPLEVWRYEKALGRSATDG